MNKKKIFGLLAAGLIAAVATTNLNIVSNEKGLSNISLANVEMLAYGESGYSCTVTVECYHGSISCTGQVCERSALGGWVKCDGHTTKC